MQRRLVFFAGLAVAAVIAACGNEVHIGPEPTGTSHVSSSGSTIGGTGGATSSSSTASGTGGATGSSSSSGGPAQGKLVTAETDIGQYQSITLANPGSPVKVVDGPFFVTDVSTDNSGLPTFTTVPGGDCSIPLDQHTTVLVASQGGSNVGQIHGIRMPVLPGQTLCHEYGGAHVTVMGFRPY